MKHRKELFEIFEGIAHINATAWDNPKYSYDDATESAYQIEEALEGFDLNSFEDVSEFFYLQDEGHGPKELSRQIISLAMNSGNEEIEDVDRFDKALDAIYFAVGSLHKLGLSPSQMVDGLAVVHSANLAKTGKKDAQGKVTKPADFVAPEPLLQAILDKRTT